jgi:DNA-binding IclR family transcriptional regulator
MNERTSDVGVLDKVVQLLEVLGTPSGSSINVAETRLTLAELAAATGIHRATAHRLLKALQVHEYVQIDSRVRWSLGPTLARLGQAATLELPLRAQALPALQQLRGDTEESVQLYVRSGDSRVCIASFESPHGLRTIVEVGAILPLAVGSAGKVLRNEPSVQQVGWAESVGEREAGVASVSAPVSDSLGVVVAAVSVSGPIERLTRLPGERYGRMVAGAARQIEVAAGYRIQPAE